MRWAASLRAQPLGWPAVLLTRMADYGVDTFDLDETDLDEETRLA